MTESAAAFFDRVLAPPVAVPLTCRGPVIPQQVCPHCKTLTSVYRFETVGGNRIESHRCPQHGDVIPMLSAVSHPVDWSAS